MRNLPKTDLDLSPQKRALLEALLQEEGIDTTTTQKISPREQAGPIPLSFAQERLWFLDKMEPGNPAYNITVSVRLTGPLNADALERSVIEIVRRHEILRTTFAMSDGQPVQVIAPTLSLTIPIADLRDLPAIERGPEALRLTDADAQQSFDLEQGPLLRVTLLQLDEAEHTLLVTMHHIISDAGSFDIFFRELSTLYEACSTDHPTPIPELPIQYADYTSWQRESFQGKKLQDQLAYWKQNLGGDLPLLELPTDRPRPVMQTFPGTTQSLELPDVLAKRLKALSVAEGATLFMTLLAAFKVLVHRYTNQQDILVGTPIANRNRVETEALIGLFQNMLVLRTDLSDNPSFREVLRRVRRVALDGYDHQDLAFEKLVEELQPERNLSHNPLFQVAFFYQNIPERVSWRTALKLPNITVSALVVHSGTSKFDLTLGIEESGGRLKASVEYNTDLFNDATMTRMLGHFQTTLEGIAADPDIRISTAPLLTETEQRQLLTEWNDTQRDYPEGQGIHQLFEAQVERNPDAVAVVFEGQQLTYRQLNTRANQLAHYLKEHGVRPQVLVGICLERSLEMMVGLLAILKAGGTYVPLDPSYPKARLAFMLEDAQVPMLLAEKKLLPLLSGHQAEMIPLDTDWSLISRERQENPVCQVTPNHLAYVIYTSGSTGNPKGVQISHRAVVNFLSAMRQQPGLTERDTLLSVTTLSFDIAVLELFTPIVVGARLVLVSDEVAADGNRLRETLNNSGATIMQATPATWRLLLTAGWGGSEGGDEAPPLRILCGGEALPRELANQLLDRCDCLWNMYGPTETTIWSTIHRIDSAEGLVSIGRPIANTQVYILDAHLQPVPIGVPGELYIGGDGLALGYLNRPELTAEKFIHHPFSDQADAHLYKTGDQVRYLPDGTIEFMGRIDHQVKIRGFRIELGEIESVLSQHPSVQENVVVVREDIPDDQRLTAYLIEKEGIGLSVNGLRDFLQEKLPDYMLPSAFVVLDALPLTPNGKVDRRALPAPHPATRQMEETSSIFLTPLESLIVEIWQEVLGVETVGVRDNFFELGGHSLLAMQVVAKLEKQLGLRINPRELMFQSLGRLASACEERGANLRKPSEAKSLTQKVVDGLKRLSKKA